jgi:hypothetical protein
MLRDDAIAKSHFGKRLDLRQELEFRSAVPVKTHPRKIV